MRWSRTLSTTFPEMPRLARPSLRSTARCDVERRRRYGIRNFGCFNSPGGSIEGKGPSGHQHHQAGRPDRPHPQTLEEDALPDLLATPAELVPCQRVAYRRRFDRVRQQRLERQRARWRPRRYQ